MIYWKESLPRESGGRLLSVSFEGSPGDLKPAANPAIARDFNEYHLPPPPGRRWRERLALRSSGVKR
jgi:hypothetical protein